MFVLKSWNAISVNFKIELFGFWLDDYDSHNLCYLYCPGASLGGCENASKKIVF